MSAAAPREAAEMAGIEHERSSRGGRRRKVMAGGVAVAVAVGLAIAFTVFLEGTRASKTDAEDEVASTSLATVTQQALSSKIQVNATLGYDGSYNVVNQANGTLTSLPEIGQVISQGELLYQVNGAPVVLLYGSTPVYRSLSEGMTGPDVAELNTNLVAMGYATKSHIPSGTKEFTSWTKKAVRKLQKDHGLKVDGILALGQAVFLPAEVRVTTVSTTLGAPVQPGQSVLTGSSTKRVVTIALDAAQQSLVKVGDKVTIALPNGQATPGVVSSVGTVATDPASGSPNSGPTITVLVTTSDPAATGSLDQAPVQVSITTASVDNALVVPVVSLLAVAGGGYAVEAVDADGTHQLIPVTLGLFDDAEGLVEVSGSGLAVGQRVVVPTS